MFKYIKNQLVLEQGSDILPLQAIAQEEKTPFYIYDIQGIKEWYKFFLDQSSHQLKVFFAMKSNSNEHVLRAFKELGSGVDVVSGGEALLAQSIGFTSEQIIFSGVGKSVEELEMAISQQFFQINVESSEELQRIIQIAKKLKKKAFIGLRLNPNVDFESHPYIKTGLIGHKFGIEESELPFILNIIKSHKEEINLQGLSMHLGSQIFDLDPLYKAIKNIKNIFEDLKKEFPSLEVLDIGGGLGVNYDEDGLEGDRLLVEKFGEGFRSIFKGFSGKVLAEPGRFLVARFGLLCARVEYVRKTPYKKFVILNSGMNHFLRSALYGAKHRILTFSLDSNKKEEIYDVVGPICETADTFSQDQPLSPVKEGDWLALADTGAYGYVMSNQYNLQLPVQEIGFSFGKRL